MEIKSPPTGWMPIYIGDYLGDTMHLTTEQHGAYILMMMAYWKNSRPLREDEINLIVRMDIKRWLAIRPVMEKFFTVHDGIWTHSRIEKEINRACKTYNAYVDRSKRGHDTRKKNLLTKS